MLPVSSVAGLVLWRKTVCDWIGAAENHSLVWKLKVESEERMRRVATHSNKSGSVNMRRLDGKIRR